MKKLLNFVKNIPIIDPIPINNVKFNKDKPISRFPISWIVEDDSGIVTIIIIKLAPTKKCVVKEIIKVLYLNNSEGIKFCRPLKVLKI